MGFCLLNNAAIAVRAVQAELQVEKVLVYDWDVHHGNGTQHVFERDPSVLYASTHQFPFYPGTGDFGEAGVGAGEGTTLNVPLPAGCGDAEYAAVAERVLVPVARSYRPELIVVSCGFDAHRDDPLAAMQLSGEGFRNLAAVMRALADELCGGRLVLLLEGGYALSGLREGTEAVLDVLLAAAAPSPARWDPVVSGGPIEGILERVSQVHGRAFLGPGPA
jgi:acetoin utilization deacetylase AcuC-like enzyme